MVTLGGTSRYQPFTKKSCKQRAQSFYDSQPVYSERSTPRIILFCNSWSFPEDNGLINQPIVPAYIFVKLHPFLTSYAALFLSAIVFLFTFLFNHPIAKRRIFFRFNMWTRSKWINARKQVSSSFQSIPSSSRCLPKCAMVPSSAQVLEGFRKVIPFLLPLLVLYTLYSTQSQHASNLPGISGQIYSPVVDDSDILDNESYGTLARMERDASRRHTLTNEDDKAATVPALQKVMAPCARDGTKAGSFLFVFMGHSGSTAILSELRSHPEIHLEATEPVDHFQYEHNTTAAVAFTRQFFTRAQSYGKIPGFKIRPWHIGEQPDEWRKIVKEFDTRVVWQYRKNILKQAVGEYSYKYLNDTSVIEGLKSKEEVKKRCGVGAGCSFAIKNMDFFHDTLKDCLHSDLVIAHSVNILLNGSSCVHGFPYEDYLYERKNSLIRLRQFLGIKEIESKADRFKATSDNLCEVVSNWKEVCSNFYACHVWRHMFDDTRNGCGCEFSSGHVRYCNTSYG